MNALKASDFSGNQAEDVFFCQLMVANLLPVWREYQFLPDRKFRLDFAFDPEHRKVAVEIEGGLWTKGAHSRPLGILRDMEKSNLAVLAGWRVLRVSPAQIKSGEALELTKKLLNQSIEKPL